MEKIYFSFSIFEKLKFSGINWDFMTVYGEWSESKWMRAFGLKQMICNQGMEISCVTAAPSWRILVMMSMIGVLWTFSSRLPNQTLISRADVEFTMVPQPENWIFLKNQSRKKCFTIFVNNSDATIISLFHLAERFDCRSVMQNNSWILFHHVQWPQIFDGQRSTNITKLTYDDRWRFTNGIYFLWLRGHILIWKAFLA